MKRTKPKLWDNIVKMVKKSSKGGKANQWSARKAQLAVKIYKYRGGGYSNKKSKKNSLTRWTNQKWRTKSGLPSLISGERYLPEKAIKNLPNKDYIRTSKEKRKSIKLGIQYSKQPKYISRKIRKYRK